MNKAEAIKAMHEGKKLTHKLFSPEEYITGDSGMFKFEDGCFCEPDEFWAYRTEVIWLLDWKLFEPQQGMHGGHNG